MGWFNKKDEEKEAIPSLPELPKLPDFPRVKEETEEKYIHQLPSLPNSPFGQKFSQNTIKDAVTGGKERGYIEEIGDFNEVLSIPPRQKEINAKQGPNFPFKEEFNKKVQEIPKEFEKVAKSIKQNEPIFIRIDKFEESLNNFERIKEQVIGIESTLEGIKKIKEQESIELEEWEKEMKTIKSQIEKIDSDLFSKVR